MNCSELTWITASTSHNVKPPSVNTHLCHVHVVVRQRQHFWRQKWIAVRDYLGDHPDVDVTIVTDLYDVYVNPLTPSSILSRFHQLTGTHNKKSLLISTEDTCWIGRICNRADVQRFHMANVSAGRFMQSQFMGKRANILHMLNWGLDLSLTDDMEMMYEYIISHPDRVTLDDEYDMFGSLAYTEPSANAPYMCRAGRCDASSRRYTCLPSHRGVCITDSVRTSCPLVWHGNGLLSRAFFTSNPHCSRMFGRRLK